MRRGPEPEPRFAFGALEKIVCAEWAGPDKWGTTECTAADVATRLHLKVCAVHRYRKHGVPLSKADALAIHLGLHPAIVWPQEWCEVAE